MRQKVKIDNHNMEYNSEKATLIIPEYGRNVQMLIKHAKTIENLEIRQAFIDKVVLLMQQMHPQNKNIEDNTEKLWKHVFRIGEYDLDVLPPSGEEPKPEDYFKAPGKIPYPNIDTRFRHYGNNVQVLIKKAIAMEDGPVKDGFITTIGSYMKLAYRTWNQEHYISDEIIKNDLEILSKGKLKLVDNTSIDTLANANRRRKRPDDRRNNDRRNDRRSNDRRSHRSNNNGHRNHRR